MKLNQIHKIFFGLLVLLALSSSSCKKESESTFDIFKGLTINFKDALASDEVYVEFNATKASSGAIMAKFVITETGKTTPVYIAPIDFTNRFSFQSGVLVLKTTNPSAPSFKITILDDLGKDITSSVTISYPTVQQVISKPALVTDKQTTTFAEGTNVYIDYDIHSENADIKYIWLESFASGTTEPSRVNIATVADSVVDKRNYRGVARINLNRDGGAKFRIYVTNGANDYIGDGYTSLHTNVEAGFEFASNKYIYAPKFDATAANPDFESACFYSISKKRAYNFNEAKAISADIDFCIYLTASGNATFPYLLNLFSLSNPTNMLEGKFDFTGWTKRTTKFFNSIPTVAQPNGAENIAAATVFNSILVSGKAINKAVGTERYANVLTRTLVTSISSGNIMFFKTQEGKFGAIFFNGFSRDGNGRYYANIDVKVEK